MSSVTPPTAEVIPSSTNAPTTTLPASLPPAPSPESKPKKKTRRPKLLANKRRGAKVEEEDDDAGGEEKGGIELAGSDSDSDEDHPSALIRDEDDDDDEEEVEPEDKEPAKPAPAAGSIKDSSTSPSTDLKDNADVKTLVAPVEIHPSWDDLAAAEVLAGKGIAGLPSLDFASLSTATLAAIPSVAQVAKVAPRPSNSTRASSSGPLDAKAKKAQLLAKREAKSAAAKEADPVAWEAAEAERTKKELEKKKEKKEKLKERKKLHAAPGVVEGTSAPGSDLPPVAASQETPTAPRTSAPRTSAPSRPSRTAVSLGLAPPPAADPSTPSTSTPTDLPAPHPNSSLPLRSNNNTNRGPPPNAVNNSHYREAADLYADRMAHPSATPRLGRFYGHDSRLALPEERPLNPYWRGRGRGGEMPGGGFQIRGRGRGARGRGEESGLGRVIASGGWNQATQTGQQSGEESAGSTDKGKDKISKEIPSKGKDSDDDGWGRGEIDRPIVSSITPEAFPTFPAAVTGWKHDGFEELDQEETRGATVVSIRGRGKGRGGVATGNRAGNGNAAGGVQGGGERSGTPGAVNPRFANLPFHPHHRFPASPSTGGPGTPNEAATTSRLVSDDQNLFAQNEANVVRIPSSSTATSAVPLVNLPSSVNLEKGATATVVDSKVVLPDSKPEVHTSVLYSADPSRVVSSAPESQAISPENPVLPSIQQRRPPPPSAYYQLPPHLQPSSSPISYPHMSQPYPTQQQQQFYAPQFYSPDAFPNMPTPGATPPPLFSSHSPVPFFAPPRPSKIEIKAPGPSHSPGHSSAPRSALSASGDAFAPRQQFGGASTSSFYEGQGQGGVVPFESGGFTYYLPSAQAQMMQQQQQQQQQYQQHQQRQQMPAGYYNPYQSQQLQQFDSAILSVTSPNPNANSSQPQSQGLAGSSQQQQQQQQQNQQQQYYGTPPAYTNYYAQQGGQLPPPAEYGRDNNNYQYQ